MITLSNLRTEPAGEWTRLVCDFDWDGNVPNPFKEKTLWFAVKKENEDFFSTKVYDPFLLVPYFIAMQYGQNLKICGKVSKKLYRNLTNYIYQILLDYSDDLKPVKCEVEGFDDVEQGGDLIGASISCGVDSFTTLYDRFINESDPEYKVNSLFFFNCGSYGSYYKKESYEGYLSRYQSNIKVANELNLPVYQVICNLHTLYTPEDQLRVGFLPIWSCVLCMQRKVKKYYISSGFSYKEIAENHSISKNHDLDEYSGSYIIPLIQTERIELIYDGAQFSRTEKTEHIAHWDIVQKHLNVCFRYAENCSYCPKCLRTIFTLETLGKLEDFSVVFDLKQYKKFRFYNHCKQVATYNKDVFSKDNVDFAKAHGRKLPPKWFACLYVGAFDFSHEFLKKIFWGERWEKMKKKFLKT